jgi:hypothetical protein
MKIVEIVTGYLTMLGKGNIIMQILVGRVEE